MRWESGRSGRRAGTRSRPFLTLGPIMIVKSRASTNLAFAPIRGAIPRMSRLAGSTVSVVPAPPSRRSLGVAGLEAFYDRRTDPFLHVEPLDHRHPAPP